MFLRIRILQRFREGRRVVWTPFWLSFDGIVECWRHIYIYLYNILCSWCVCTKTSNIVVNVCLGGVDVEGLANSFSFTLCTYFYISLTDRISMRWDPGLGWPGRPCRVLCLILDLCACFYFSSRLYSPACMCLCE